MTGVSIPPVLYKDVRCGLFHEPITKSRIYIQCGSLENKRPVGPHNGRILIDPWRLREELEGYLQDFFEEAKSDEALANRVEAYSRAIYKGL